MQILANQQAHTDLNSACKPFTRPCQSTVSTSRDFQQKNQGHREIGSMNSGQGGRFGRDNNCEFFGRDSNNQEIGCSGGSMVVVEAVATTTLTQEQQQQLLQQLLQHLLQQLLQQLQQLQSSR